MDYIIKVKQISIKRTICHIELIPENESESESIDLVTSEMADKEQRSFITEYLTQCILKQGYSPINLIRAYKRTFEFMVVKA